jgi:CubicO group peptidase (beta-lactamase class C family)
VSVSRRHVLGLALTAAAAGCAAPAEEDERAATPAAATAAATAAASPEAPAPYAPAVTDALRRFLVPTPQNPGHPIYAGAVALAVVDGVTTVHTAVGDALRYKAGPVELPPAERVPMRPDSVFDIASITKVFTAIVTLQQVERGTVDLDAPVARYLSEFTGAGKSAVTVRMLLTHTSGLPVGATVPRGVGPYRQRLAVLTTPLVSGAGTTFRYSSVGLMVLAHLVHEVTGLPIDHLVRTEICTPLGLRDTGYRPLTWMTEQDRAARLVATDARTSRGLLRGEVHDDVAAIMGGVAGHAGIFATAADIAAVGQMLLAGGIHNGQRILAEDTVRRMLTDATAGLPVVDADHPQRPADHGLGVTLGQPWFMGKLSAVTTFGHTGFTGTSLLVDPRRKLVLVILTNRAHPNWSWGNPDPARVAVADILADAMA